VQYPSIDAMRMFRRDMLLDLVAFALRFEPIAKAEASSG
jgi:hypothetical protein